MCSFQVKDTTCRPEQAEVHLIIRHLGITHAFWDLIIFLLFFKSSLSIGPDRTRSIVKKYK